MHIIISVNFAGNFVSVADIGGGTRRARGPWPAQILEYYVNSLQAILKRICTDFIYCQNILAQS